MKLIVTLFVFSQILFSQDMNPDGYIGGLTLKGFYTIHNSEWKHFYGTDDYLGKGELDDTKDFEIFAAFPISTTFTASFYYRYYSDRSSFTPSTYGSSIGFERNRQEFTGTNIGFGFTYYLKRLF